MCSECVCELGKFNPAELLGAGEPGSLRLQDPTAAAANTPRWLALTHKPQPS